MQSGGCEDVGLSSHAPCLFVFFSLSICLSICLLSTLFLSVYYALDFSLTPSLRPPSGCSNELINHGCWCLAGLAVTKEVANKLLWRKGKKKKNGGRFCMPKATPWQTVIKCCSAKFYFLFFSVWWLRGRLCATVPSPVGWITSSQALLNFQISRLVHH